MVGESRTRGEEKRRDAREELEEASHEGPALLEVDHLSGFDHNLLAGFGIAGFTLRTGTNTEDSEVPELHGVARPQALSHGFKEEIHQLPSVFPPNPGKLVGQPDYQFGFCHGIFLSSVGDSLKNI